MTHLTAQAPCLTAHASAGIFARLAALFGIAEQRHRLAHLDDAALNDIGITRAQALAESRRPMWDMPKSRGC